MARELEQWREDLPPDMKLDLSEEEEKTWLPAVIELQYDHTLFYPIFYSVFSRT